MHFDSSLECARLGISFLCKRPAFAKERNKQTLSAKSRWRLLADKVCLFGSCANAQRLHRNRTPKRAHLREEAKCILSFARLLQK